MVLKMDYTLFKALNYLYTVLSVQVVPMLFSSREARALFRHKKTKFHTKINFLRNTIAGRVRK
jgi:hypothetical protein